MSKKFYEQTWFIVLILIVFFPAGLVLVWTNKQWSQKGKIIATVIVAVLVILGLGGRSRGLKETQPETVTEVTSETTIQEETEKPQLIDYKLVEQKEVGNKYTYRIVVDPSATEQQLLDVFKYLDTTSYEYAIAWFYSSEELAYDYYDVAVIERTGDEEPICTDYKGIAETTEIATE